MHQLVVELLLHLFISASVADESLSNPYTLAAITNSHRLQVAPTYINSLGNAL
jgi:hypothetical protein